MAHKQPRVTVPPPHDDVQTAYQIHTLAQLLYARLVAAPSWTPSVPVPFPPVMH
jgi:hypothetical protein